MIDNQFYPTPPHLVEIAWGKFKTRNVTALLEPSAGRANLLERSRGHNNHAVNITDCIESMADNIAVLKQKNFRVVDTDFLNFRTSKLYSHIIMNPPFANGVEHVLKAWDILVHGEIVAIINSASITNPNNIKKKFLLKLIEEHGDVEFHDEAFMSPDTQRKTNVRVAVIHLTKISRDEPLFNIGNFGLNKDTLESEFDEQMTDEKENLSRQLSIPNSTIKNTVIAFNQASEAIREMVSFQCRADYFKSRVTGPRHVMGAQRESTRYQADFNKEYDDLKKHAWSTIINETEFTSKFSSKVIKELEQELETIKNMEFTVRNIYGLLEGLMINKTKLDNDMLLEVFDSITKFHSGNRSLYRGWKSNDKHRSRAFRVKHTRFIMRSPSSSCSSYFGYEGKRLLADFDKAFALLDGKVKPEIPLESIFSNKETYSELCQGERLGGSYLEARFYLGANSLHFFPTKKGKELIERLNRMVGGLRSWLPDEETVSPNFWEQYEKSEKITKVIVESEEYKKCRDWDFYNEGVHFDYVEIHSQACESLDIPVFNRLEADEHPGTQLALAV